MIVSEQNQQLRLKERARDVEPSVNETSTDQYYQMQLLYERVKKVFDLTAIATTATVLFTVLYTLANKEPAYAPLCVLFPEAVALGMLETLGEAVKLQMSETEQK